MRGIIEMLDGEAKIDITSRLIRRVNPETLQVEYMNEGDRGGYCDICKIRFKSVFELIDHFKKEHDRR